MKKILFYHRGDFSHSRRFFRSLFFQLSERLYPGVMMLSMMADDSKSVERKMIGTPFVGGGGYPKPLIVSCLIFILSSVTNSISYAAEGGNIRYVTQTIHTAGSGSTLIGVFHTYPDPECGDPLHVIDGLQSDAGQFNLNFNNIASIAVLKDAFAPIYGVRAANGVVVVTTVSINAYYEMPDNFKFTEPADATTYVIRFFLPN